MADVQFGVADSSYLAAGGEPGLRKLATDFYDIMSRVDEAKTIRDMHPQDLTESIDKLALFLCGWLGGPKLFQEKYGSIRLPMIHKHLPIAQSEKNAWMKCMAEALVRQNYSDQFKQYLIAQLNVPAERIRMVCSKEEEE